MNVQAKCEVAAADSRRNDEADREVGRLGGPDFIQLLLEEQRSLTAAEEFSSAHGEAQTTDEARAFYSRLVPASPPEPGRQYAFEVDLDRCSGCKACVTACHSLNGLDEQETWRDVGLLIGGSDADPLLQHVTTACHHCVDPACLAACPVDAYEKDRVSGIVKHLDDQCFGCQYCTLACPYEVPKYHPGKGIVRKCDMCSQRLEIGEAPACVQACPHEAISIRVVDRQSVVDDAETAVFLPGAPDPQITLPTTHYKTRRVFPRNTLPADHYSVSPRHPHWPLIAMLVLTQFSVGAFAMGAVVEAFAPSPLAAAVRPLSAIGALVVGLTALASSTLHLGRPHLAWRAVIGLRHSWLSREIVAFGAFACAAVSYSAVVAFAPASPLIGVNWLLAAVIACGAIGVFCSAMIYAFTQREFWIFPRTATRFAATCVILGAVGVWTAVFFTSFAPPIGVDPSAGAQLQTRLAWGVLTASLAKLAFDAVGLLRLWERRVTSLKRSALLMTRQLSNVTLARFAASLVGGVLAPGMLLLSPTTVAAGPGDLIALVAMAAIVAGTFTGEILERYLFFAAAAPDRMPGGIRT